MNTIKTYTGTNGFIPPGFEITNKNLRYRTDVLIDVVQALIDRIAEKEGIRLGVMMTSAGFELYETPKEDVKPPTNEAGGV